MIDKLNYCALVIGWMSIGTWIILGAYTALCLFDNWRIQNKWRRRKFQCVKSIPLIFFLLVSVSYAQQDGFSKLLADELKNTETGVDINLKSGKVGSITYLPIVQFHTQDKSLTWLKANVGVEIVSGSKMRGLVFPSTDVVGVMNYLFFNNLWSKSHVTNAKLPPIYFGLGIAPPLDWQELRSSKWEDARDWLRGAMTVKFGNLIK